MLSIGECVQFACILEATARKPGNVHRFQDFDDLTYLDFLVSAAVIAPILEKTVELGVGPAVLQAVTATRKVVKTNSNLGIILLLAPLAAVPRNRDIRTGVTEVLDRLTIEDARAVFEAIRLADPGGLGAAPQQDVREEPTLPLREIMRLAARRDLVACQYANGYRELFDFGVAQLTALSTHFRHLETAIVYCHLYLLDNLLDTHIVRKCGIEEAVEVSRRASEARTGANISEFDAWLRADGHRRNPGATADLVCASLFVALREGIIKPPFEFGALP